jgi:hypothetical protein
VGAGATIDEIVSKLEWQPHTVRGAIAGALKKKLGLEVASEKDDKRGRIYRIASDQPRSCSPRRVVVRSGGFSLWIAVDVTGITPP